MEKSIIIGSLNIQNKYKIKDYDGLDEKGNDNAQLLNRFLIENNIDVLGTQELVREFIDRIRDTIKPNYKMYGNFRFGSSSIVKKLEIFDKFNETVSILSKHPVLKNKTITLPWIPHNPKDIIKSIKCGALRPRVATITLIDIPSFGKINFINTHLDHKMGIIQIRQMNCLYEVIKKSKYPVVLTGDFNLTTSSPKFRMFVENLEGIGYKRVPNSELTWKYQKEKLPIDHIFIPKDWKIEDYKISKDKYMENFSDHYPLLVKISK